jgi:hypothetical protein
MMAISSLGGGRIVRGVVYWQRIYGGHLRSLRHGRIDAVRCSGRLTYER